jgi:hypothetical protein
MKVNLGSATGFSAAERAKLDAATKKLGEVLNSREFRDGVMSATYAGKQGYASDSRSPAEVYATIRAAKENFTSTSDSEVDLNVRLESFGWAGRHVVGYTTHSSDTLTTNRRFFSAYSPAEVAGHLGHEWLHTLGFEHDSNRTARRPDSVPYEVGYLIERLAERGNLTPL